MGSAFINGGVAAAPPPSRKAGNALNPITAAHIQTYLSSHYHSLLSLSHNPISGRLYRSRCRSGRRGINDTQSVQITPSTIAATTLLKRANSARWRYPRKPSFRISSKFPAVYLPGSYSAKAPTYRAREGTPHKINMLFAVSGISCSPDLIARYAHHLRWRHIPCRPRLQQIHFRPFQHLRLDR